MATAETPRAATAAPPRRRAAFRRRETFAFYGFLSPWLLGFLALTSVPLVLAFAMSLSNLTTVNLHTNLHYVGGLLGLWRTLFYIAVVVPVVAKAFIWKAVFAQDGGLLNRVLGALGGSGNTDWLLDHPTASLVMLLVWGGAGIGMLIFIAGLKGIPEELYEVARIDGASAVRRFCTITLPLLTPVIMFQLVWGLFLAANVFIEPILLSPGLQQGFGSTVPTSNITVNIYALQRIFIDGDFGYGAAIAWIFVLLLLIVSALVFLSGRFWVFYGKEQYGK